jgi:FG-GAP-like repeat
MRALIFRVSLVVLLSSYWLAPIASCQERTVIDDRFPGAYQVEVADVNGDKRPDVIAVGGSTCAWYENPTWKKRIVSTSKQTPGIISSATADLDGDGKAEIAIAYEFEMNRPTIGKLLMARQGSGPDDPWTLIPIADVDSIHRLRWGDVDGDKRPDLVVAPIFGREAKPPDFASPARLQVFSTGDDPGRSKWTGTVVADRRVIHAIEVIDANGDGLSDILTASNAGVDLFRGKSSEPLSLTAGFPGQAPKRGSSEVHLGRLADGRRFLATIEPWHGSEVVVCYADDFAKYKGIDDAKAFRFGPRVVIDNTLAEGHALWVADIDGDGDDEVFAGHRGKDRRVSMYDYDRGTKAWTRTVLDRDIAAQDLRGGDLDGDGTPDVVAVGGATHNVVWYRFRRR